MKQISEGRVMDVLFLARYIALSCTKGETTLTMMVS